MAGLILLVGAILVVGAIVVTWRLDDRVRGRGGGPPDQVGVAWRDGLLSPDGRRMAVRVPGRPIGGDRPCGAWYVGLVAAHTRGLRVTVITIPGPASPSGQACPSETTDRCAAVTLPYPPGDRPVFDGVNGTVPPLRTAATNGDLCAQLTPG
jgi:hypothetical protein